jgi:hypothetical protein
MAVNSFITLTLWGNVIKHFVCNLRIFVLCFGICKNILEKLVRDKHTSLLQTLVTYGLKKLYNFDT